MDKQTHTPGPWSVWTSCSWRRIGNREGVLVCEPIVQRGDNHPDLFFRNGGPDGPDARLIAAAPTMLAALLAIDSEGKDANRDGGVTIPSAIWDLVQQAIARATAEHS